jgi:hypothetical protein
MGTNGLAGFWGEGWGRPCLTKKPRRQGAVGAAREGSVWAGGLLAIIEGTQARNTDVVVPIGPVVVPVVVVMVVVPVILVMTMTPVTAVPLMTVMVFVPLVPLAHKFELGFTGWGVHGRGDLGAVRGRRGGRHPSDRGQQNGNEIFFHRESSCVIVPWLDLAWRGRIRSWEPFAKNHCLPSQGKVGAGRRPAIRESENEEGRMESKAGRGVDTGGPLRFFSLRHQGLAIEDQRWPGHQ